MASVSGRSRRTPSTSPLPRKMRAKASPHDPAPPPEGLTPVVCPSHTVFMKVAVSIPDQIFREAERISRRIRLPRSQFYAHALEAYVRERSGEEITERLNEVYAKRSSKLDPAAEALSLEVLRREKW